MRDSLFGFLAMRFGSHPENLATEAFNFILQQSVAAKQELIRYIEQSGASFPEKLNFRTQVFSEDNAIPDLVGFDPNDRTPLILESKFWAGLTDKQPVLYLRQLPSDHPGVLAFIVPKQRVASLWPELLARCKGAEVQISEVKTIQDGYHVCRINEIHYLVLINWRSVLLSMRSVLESQEDIAGVNDITQLLGLCERMDSEAFLPLTSEDLTGNFGSRLLQYCGIIDDVTAMLVGKGLADTHRLTTGAGSGYYGRYMRLAGNGCFLHFSANSWVRFRNTPLWLRIKDHDWKITETLRRKLSAFERSVPSQLFESSDGLLVPIFLPVGVERTQVVEEVMIQVETIIGYLSHNSEEGDLESDER